MKDLTKRWIEFAREDLKAAEALIVAPQSFRSYQLSVMHCQQAIEKVLKAVLMEKGVFKSTNIIDSQ
ncbi:MAG: HEPN domain-containing protein [Patescibacteria group bacterium]